LSRKIWNEMFRILIVALIILTSQLGNAQRVGTIELFLVTDSIPKLGIYFPMLEVLNPFSPAAIIGVEMRTFPMQSLNIAGGGILPVRLRNNHSGKRS